MNLWSRYVAYIKKNPEGYWFRRKVWGWGWVPATWQGWATLAVFIVVLVLMLTSFLSIPKPRNAEAVYFVGKVILWAVLLLIVCYTTGEPPKWQWGFPDEE